MAKLLITTVSVLLMAACAANDRTGKADSATVQPSAGTPLRSAASAEGSSSEEVSSTGGENIESRGLRGLLYERKEPRFVPMTPLPDSGGAVACSRDQGDPQSTAGRDLSGYMRADPSMTNSTCRSTCASRGFVFAGTQYGSYCFCGTTFGKYGAASNCTMGCSGNPGETCGGAWANSISLSGAEPKVPAAPTNGSQCVVWGKGTLQHANPKIVGTYRYLEIQRWEVTGPPVPNGTGYLLPVMWTTTGSGSLHEEDGVGGVTDTNWGISGARATQFQQVRSGANWKINQVEMPFTIPDGIVETRRQTINGVAKPLVVSRNQAAEAAYGDILTFGQNITVQHDVRPLGAYTWYRKPFWSAGGGDCEAQITLGPP